MLGNMNSHVRTMRRDVCRNPAAAWSPTGAGGTTRCCSRFASVAREDGSCRACSRASRVVAGSRRGAVADAAGLSEAVDSAARSSNAALGQEYRHQDRRGRVEAEQRESPRAQLLLAGCRRWTPTDASWNDRSATKRMDVRSASASGRSGSTNPSTIVWPPTNKTTGSSMSATSVGKRRGQLEPERVHPNLGQITEW